jgi:hypothetical protein
MNDRTHPYDLLGFPDDEEWLKSVVEESREHRVDLMDRERFAMMLCTGEVIRKIVPPDASPEQIWQAAGLTFHCYHFRAAGKRTFNIEEPVLRELLSTGFVAGPIETVPPCPAGYVHLPRNRVWSRIANDAKPEAIDGFFFTGDDLLFILGLLPGRPGFSVLPVRAAHGETPITSVAELKAREEGEDFANVLPGGEMQGHFAITNNMEALKLAARCFWHLAPRG